MGVLAHILDKMWIIIIIAGLLLVANNIAENENNSQQQPENVSSWPKVFVLSPDPEYPVVCYSGITFNFSENGSNETDKKSIFALSTDPKFPVTCRVGHIPENLKDNNATETTVEEGEGYNSTNLTCIRRDYENNVSAIFLYHTGPLQLAWNIFNSSKPYGYMTVENINSIGSLNLLNETVVDCELYVIPTDDKGLCAAAALCNSG